LTHYEAGEAVSLSVVVQQRRCIYTSIYSIWLNMQIII